MDWRERIQSLSLHTEEEELQAWYAVFVTTGSEDNVKQKIAYAFKDKGIHAVVPKRCIKERRNGIWHEKIKPLFPGYLLLQGDITTTDYYTLKSTPDILRVLRDNTGLQRIYPEEIAIIKRLMCNGDLIGTSVGLQQGDDVIIVEGPLLGMEGLISSIDRRKERVKVKLSILGDVRTIDLSIKIIQSA